MVSKMSKMSYSSKRRIGKKAQIRQIAFILAYVLSFAFLIIIIAFIVSAFFTAFNDTGLASSNTVQVENAYTAVARTQDMSFPFLLIGLTVGLIITSFLIPSHPIFIVVNIVGIFILVLVSMIYSNMFGTVVTDPTLSSTAANFPFTVYIMNYLPYICVPIVFISTIIMYAKYKSGGGQ